MPNIIWVFLVYFFVRKLCLKYKKSLKVKVQNCYFLEVSFQFDIHILWLLIPIRRCFKLNFWRSKFCTCSVELHFNTLLHEIFNLFIDKSNLVHSIPLTGSQLVYCISDRDITKQIMPYTLSIMQICWPEVVKCCPRAQRKPTQNNCPS